MDFVQKKTYLRGIILHFCIQKKSAAESPSILDDTYDDQAMSETTCRDFDVKDKERYGVPKNFEDEEF